MATDLQPADALRDLPFKIQTASLKERREVVDSVCSVLSSPEITEQTIKGLCKVIQSTLLRYRDSTSQSFILKLLECTVKLHREWMVKYFIPVLVEIAERYVLLVPSSSTSQSSLYALKWSCILLQNAFENMDDVSFQTIVSLQSGLLLAVTAYGNSKKNTKAYLSIHHTWLKLGNKIEEKWFQALEKIPIDSPQICIMVAVLCKHLRSLEKLSIFQKYKERNIECFMKNFISTKVRPNLHLVKSCEPFLLELNSDDIKNYLVPSMQKAMLRNPEIIIETIGTIVQSLSVDLNTMAVELSKNLIGYLHSNDENVRFEAAVTCKILASKISDVNVIIQIVKQLFDVFNGANGKLTLAEHKATVLLGAGNFSYNNINECDKLKVFIEVSKLFFKLLEVESHEKILCCCLEKLTLWSKDMVGELPIDVINAFKKGLKLKSTTQLVRIGYLQWLGQCLNKMTLPISECDEVTNIVVKIVEKAIQQPGQHGTVSEGLCAAYILLKLDTDNQFPQKHSTIWNAFTSTEKQVFLQDKFLTSITDDLLVFLILSCDHILSKYFKNNNDVTMICRGLILCSLHSSRTINSMAVKHLRHLVAHPNKCSLTRMLITQLTIYLDGLKQHQNGLENSTENSFTVVNGKAITNLITVLCSYNEYPTEDLQLLAIDALLPAHHPLIMKRDLWLKITKHFKLSPKQLIRTFMQNICNRYIHSFQCNNSYKNIISTLVAQNPDAMLSSIVSYVLETLEDPELLKITRDEYFTFLTPEGELYDKSGIPGSEDNAEMNMKRESKAYSYKDQLEELQLRRELAETKRSSGKDKAKELTPKQKEAVKMQLNKESNIRKKLTEFEIQLKKVEHLILAASIGDRIGLGRHAGVLLSRIVSALRSPLAAPRLSSLFIDLRSAFWPSKYLALANMVAHVTLRVVKPQCDLDSNWEDEDLDKAVSRTISQLHSCTVAQVDRSSESSPMSNRNFFPAPAFCYCFQLIYPSLTSNVAKGNQKTIQEGLQIISHHSKMRGNKRDVYHPDLLPVQQMFQLLIMIIGSHSGRIQSQSVATLLDAAVAVSGNEGCGQASTAEISCLLSGLQNPSEVVRDASLRALLKLINVFPSITAEMEKTLSLKKRLWIAKFDVSDTNRQLASELWTASNLKEELSLIDEVTAEVAHPVEAIQKATASALAALLETNLTHVPAIMTALLELYNEKLTMIPPKLDEFGHVIEPPVDEWGGRRGVGLALNSLAPLLKHDAVGQIVKFFVSSGLGDRAEEVRKEMFNAAMTIVELHGKDTVSDQLPVFEQFLDKAPKTGSFDVVRQAVVILVGSLARHLSPEDPRIQPITLRLIAALSTPSQQVQEAVSNCLPYLITSPVLRDETTGIVNKLMQKLLKGEKYGDRKGAAYGLAGIVKGLGILALKQLDIMTRLTEAIQDKKNYKHREGALFAFEMLCTKLGRLFEPYIVHVLPHLLLCFGDTSQYVRTATDDTAKVVMSKLSAHGVKLVLPSLLAALEDDSWRTKTGSIELLGAMAYCAPKQLSSCLPSIVPKLIEVLSDSHVKVQEAGAEALKVIGSVIRNPEIQAIVPPLLEALQDPSSKTSACLQTLLDTQFVHFIDAPSLALIMPVVQRAFMDRSTETRKMAAQIIGNMYSLTDQKDLMPYLPNIIPGLKTSLLDPVPEVRSVSARALGAMVRGMGEASFEDLLPWLMHTLTSETSSVDRSGAAQGLSEVVAGLGVEKLHKLMPDIIATSERTDIAPHVKDGYIMMFIYMPGAFTNEFTPYIGQIINPILKALADENEYVRDTALKAGQRIVNLYADSAIMLLLPELEKGLFDDDWRIRYSSVQLLGDLLYRISGVSGKMSTETASEDDNFGTEQSHSAIMTALGQERRNRVLAGLYMGRSDVALMVRQAALHVWKVVVTNTPRTLREILPTLFGLLLGCLASTSFDKRQVAARTLGDLVRKLGERVLPEIIPILERGLQSDRPDQRQGVCIGLSEIMASTSKDMVLTFVNSLVPTVRRALCDPLPEVRSAAAKTFDSLHSTVGVRALDDILPAMLNGLNDPDPEVAEATLDGLRQVMAIKSRVVLPYLVPQLSAPPVNTKALSILASVAGDALTKYLHKILPALLNALCGAQGTPNEARELEYCRGVVLSVSDEAGVRAVMDALLEGSRSPVAQQRRAAATLLAAFCSHTRADYAHYIPQLLRGLIHLFGDTDNDVLLMAWEALQAVTKSMDAEQQIQHVSDIRQAVRFAMSDLKGVELLPGFCLPKGITPILPLFRESILNGLPEEKEAAALMLGEVIRLTSAQALQPSVVHITGPLIRILGDRFNANVKAAVLETLALLLSKVGVMLKQFLPQLQTTFLKALNDPNKQVRVKAGYALSQLILIHTRADPLFVEMHNGIKNSEDLSVKETMLQALRSVISGGGEKMSESLAMSVLTTLTSSTLLGHPEDPPRSAVGGCLGALLHCLPSAACDNALQGQILSDDLSDWVLRHGRSCALFVALKEHPDKIYVNQYKDKINKALLSFLTNDKVAIVCNGIRGIGYLFKYLQLDKQPVPQVLIVPFSRTMNHTNNDVKQLLARVCTMLGKCVPPENMAPELLKLLLPTLVNGTKEKNGYVKANSEIALISVLRLRHGDEVQKKCLQLLEVGACESLNDVVSKVLKKTINQPEGKEEELDCTLIT